jgi:hypothetical protein
MDAHIRAEFGLSVSEYDCLLRTLQTRFGVRFIEDIAFLSAEQLVGVTDRFEAAAVRRLFNIATTHIGIEKLHRSRAVSADPKLTRKKTEASTGESDACSFIKHNKRLGLRREDGVESDEVRRIGEVRDVRVAYCVDFQVPLVRPRSEHDHESMHAEVGVADVDQGQELAHREHGGERLDGVGRAVVPEQQHGDPGTVREGLGDALEAGPGDAVAGDVEVLQRGQVCEDLGEAGRAVVTEAIGGHDELR